MRDSIFIPTLLLASHCHASMMYVNPGMVPSGELHYRDRRGSHRRIPNASTEEFMIFSMDDEESDRRQATESASRDRGEPPRARTAVERSLLPRLLIGFEDDRFGEFDSDVEAIIARMSYSSDPESVDGDVSIGSKHYFDISPDPRTGKSLGMGHPSAVSASSTGIPTLSRNDLNLLRMIPPPTDDDLLVSRSLPLSSSAPSGSQLQIPRMELPPASSKVRGRKDEESPSRPGQSALFRGYNSDGDT